MGLSKLNRGLSTGLWGLGANAQGGAVSPPPPPAPPYPTPWAYYPLSTDANDASGNGRDLTGTQGSYSGSGGVVSGYTDGVISLTNAASASPTTWTMCAWMKPTGGVTSGSGPQLDMNWDGTQIRLFFFSSFEVMRFQMPGALFNASASWLHVATVNNGSISSSYTDGSYRSQSSIGSNDSAFTINNSLVTGNSNQICEVAIWKDTELTALEIAAVYDQGDAGNPLVS